MRFNPSRKPTELSQRSFLRVAGYGGAALLWPARTPLSAEDAPVDASTVSLMEFDVAYRSRISSLPSNAEVVHLWMPLPSTDTAQEIGGLEIRCPVPHQINRDPIYGSRMIHVEAKPEPFSLEARYQVRRSRARVMPATLDANSRKKFLQVTPRVRMTAEIEAFASDLIGDSSAPSDIARKVFDGIAEHLVYDNEIPGCGTGDTAWVMRHKRGKCDDYHALFMAILVSRGIPVRWQQGFPLPLPSGHEMASGSLKGDCTGSHCWVHFFDEERGWVPVDVSEADKAGAAGGFFFGQLGPNRFKVSEGRAVNLEPPQGGDALTSFAYAYAEADGIPLIYGVNYENLIDFTITRVERG